MKRSHRAAAVVDDDKGGDADCNLSFPQYLTLLSVSPFTRGIVKAFQMSMDKKKKLNKKRQLFRCKTKDVRAFQYSLTKIL